MQDNAFRAAYESSFSMLGVSSREKRKEQIAQVMCVTPRTVQEKLRYPGSITLSELRSVAKYLKLSPEQILSFIREA